MKAQAILLTLSFLMTCSSSLCADEWESLFDGETLTGWSGNPAFWSVEGGAITGTTTGENPTRGNTFLIYTGDNEEGEPVEIGDFTLRLEYRISGKGGNSGIQYRSFLLEGDHDGWRVGGYQFDISTSNTYTGTNYGEKFRGTLGARGRKTTITGSKTVETERGPREQAIREAVSFADSNELKKQIRDAPEWNEIEIIVKGYEMVHKVNGQVMSEVTDLDETKRRNKGLLAIQLHAGPRALQVMTNPFNPEVLVNVPVEDIASREPWHISSMPPGLINTMNANELSDLIAYILSAGNPEGKYFGSK